MKTKLILLFVLLLSIRAYGQEPVFSETEDDLFVTKAKFVEEFHFAKYDNVTPYILKQKTFELDRSGRRYVVNCMKFRNWKNDPGDIHVVEIRRGGRRVFSMTNDLGWECIDNETQGPGKTSFYYKVNLDDDTIALVFMGIYIMSQPPYLTVFVLKKGHGGFVFNKPFYVNDIKSDGYETVFTLQSNTLEYLDINSGPINSPDLHTLTFKDGMMYYK